MMPSVNRRKSVFYSFDMIALKIDCYCEFDFSTTVKAQQFDDITGRSVYIREWSFIRILKVVSV